MTMETWLTIVALLLLASVGIGLWRVWRGPERTDRMMGALLAGTGGVAVVNTLAALSDWTGLDVALTLALLAALTAVAFAKAASNNGTGDPESEPADPAQLKPLRQVRPARRATGRDAP